VQQVALNPGQSQRFSRAGEMLHVLNDPMLLFSRVGELTSDYVLRLSGSAVLVGFDRVPTIDSYEMAVPPFMEACFAVPASVSNVYLAVTGALDGSKTFFNFGTAAQTHLIEWLECGTSPFFRQVVHPVLGKSTSALLGANDNGNKVWPAMPQTPLLDQQIFGVGVPFLRPKIAPSVADTVHQVTAANTLFNFTGVNNVLNNAARANQQDIHFNVVQRIYVSVSAPCLFVLGGPDLTVGTLGVDEIVRWAFAAAGGQVFDFGEGMNTQALSTGGAWRAYTSAIVTLDATVIAG
jgi:hypothetical protein